MLCTEFSLLVQIQYGGFIRARAKKIGDMIRDRVRILYLIFLCGFPMGFERSRKIRIQKILFESPQLSSVLPPELRQSERN